MRTIQRQIVSALIFSKNRKLFLGKKDPKAGGVYSDCWHIPGGGLDEGENQLTGLQREVYEETGIDVSNYPVKLISDTGRDTTEKTLKETGEIVLCEMLFYVYQVDITDKNAGHIEVKLQDDLVEYMWVDIKDLRTLKLTPPSVELFYRLGYIENYE